MSKRSLLSLLLLLLALTALTGCYTQLATRHQAGSYPAEAYAQAAPADSVLPDSLADSATLAERRKAAPGEPPTVIVNNYYDAHPQYRGYAHWQWDFPLVSFGYYSSRYDRYHRPWWWDDPWYSRRHYHGHRHGHYHGRPDYRPSTPNVPSGPYKSEKRLYNDPPTYRSLDKGRRREEAAPASTPAQSTPTYQDPAPAAPASKTSSDGGSSSQGSSGGGESKASDTEDKKDGEYRSLKKGKRR